MKLLTVNADAKTVKGSKLGYLTGILYLSPATESGLLHRNGAPINTCPMATDGCKAACLYTAGRAAIFPMVNEARRRKTAELFSNPEAFKAQLRKDISALVRKAARLGLKPCVRINGTSDLPKLALDMAHEFPMVQFYDYTKIPAPWKRVRSNYHLTFSLSENNAAEAMEALARGVNVAVVFQLKKTAPLPETFMGHTVLNGDVSDLRFADAQSTDGRGQIVGLYAKGRAKKDKSGFVQSANFVPLAALAASASL